MKLKPYPEYEDSGIKWIGEIPDGWEVRKLKFISRLFGRIGFRGYTVSDLVEEGKGALTIGGKHISKNQKLDLSSPEYLSWVKYKESPEIMIEQGNILITQRGTLGKVVLIDKDIGPATINPSMILIKEIKLLSEYLYYFLVSDFSIQEVALINSQTAVPMISQEQADNFHIIFPRNEQDQTTIAAFLDKKNAKMDSLIDKDKKLIELLKEKRTALINHAVTKGLDQNVKFKDSGVEWIGVIPEGWEVGLIKNKTDKITDGAHISPELDNGTYPFISTVNVKNGKIDFVNCLLTSGENYRLLKAQGCKPERGDILYSKDGTIGETVMVNEEKEFVVASSLIIIRPNSKLVKSDFLNYLFQSSIIFERINSLVKGSALRRISLTNIKRVYGLFPPKTEQTAIASFLDSKNAKIDKAIKLIEQKINLLQEYKKSLIHHVVTGKVDVRKSEV